LVRRLCLLAVLFALAAVLALPLDLPIASVFRRDVDGDLIHDLVSLAEVFAHGLGVACILLTAYVLDVRQRRRMPRVIAAVVGAGLSVDLIKLLVGRFRPRGLEVAQVWDSFCGWFPMFRPEIRQGLSVGQCQSLPSGHAAVATALAIGLAMLYPRGRWLFVTFAVLAGLQRVESCAHYPSDTLAGAAVACLVCAAFLSNRGIGRWFDRWDASEANHGCDFSAEAIR
jgi:membrane-associated phospholipid phosphatase